MVDPNEQTSSIQMKKKKLDVFGLKLNGWNKTSTMSCPMVRFVGKHHSQESIKVAFFDGLSREVRFFDEIDELNWLKWNENKLLIDLSNNLSPEQCLKNIDDFLIRANKLESFK